MGGLKLCAQRCPVLGQTDWTSTDVQSKALGAICCEGRYQMMTDALCAQVHAVWNGMSDPLKVVKGKVTQLYKFCCADHKRKWDAQRRPPLARCFAPKHFKLL